MTNHIVFLQKIFKNSIVREAFLSILRITDSLKVDDNIAMMNNYKNIIKIMEDALEKLAPVKFDWLKNADENKQNKIKRRFFGCMGCY